MFIRSVFSSQGVSRDFSKNQNIPQGSRLQSSRSTLEAVAASASGTINLLSGETVYNQGDEPISCFVVLKGTVCAFVVDKTGGSTLFEAGPGSILGGSFQKKKVFLDLSDFRYQPSLYYNKQL